tara:strand:- start:1080 stop:1616 length:537 start_codon:yes stop_codon:yes gene_type:complete
MIVEKTKFKDLLIINHKIYNDERGAFTITYQSEILNNLLKKKVNFVQENKVYSKNRVLRGLHFQKNNYQQAKLITVLKGNIFDVAVDIRKKSKTYGEYYSAVLSESDHKSLFIPRGFAHGYLTLTDEVIVSYRIDNIYSKEFEDGIPYDDQKLKINWNRFGNNFIISEKDKNWSDFKW